MPCFYERLRTRCKISRSVLTTRALHDPLAPPYRELPEPSLDARGAQGAQRGGREPGAAPARTAPSRTRCDVPPPGRHRACVRAGCKSRPVSYHQGGDDLWADRARPHTHTPPLDITLAPRAHPLRAGKGGSAHVSLTRRV